jgi:hypothetical protein
MSNLLGTRYSGLLSHRDNNSFVPAIEHCFFLIGICVFNIHQHRSCRTSFAQSSRAPVDLSTRFVYVVKKPATRVYPSTC